MVLCLILVGTLSTATKFGLLWVADVLIFGDARLSCNHFWGDTLLSWIVVEQPWFITASEVNISC